MLVLNRKRGERIIIGDNVEVVIVQVRGDAVRVGIIAPPEVPVHREEIRNRIERDRKLKTA